MIGSKGVPVAGGVEIAVEEVCARLSASGHEVTVYASPGAIPSPSVHRGCLVKPLGPRGAAWLDMPLRTVAAARDVRLAAGSFDVVHIHSVDPFLLARGLSAVLPTAVTSHGQAWRLGSAGLLRRAASLLAERAFLASPLPASAVSKVLAGRYAGRRAAPVEHIPNGARLLAGGSGAAPGRLGLKPGGYALFVSGRLIPSKGLHLLFRAWRLLDPPLDLAVAAPTGDCSAYALRMRREAPGGTKWCGVLTGQGLGDLMRMASFAVFPSGIEAQSLALLDLLANSPTVLYSSTPENVEAAAGLGIPFSPGDPEALASGIELAMKGGGEASDAVRTGFMAGHDWDSIASAYESFLLRAAGFVPPAGASV